MIMTMRRIAIISALMILAASCAAGPSAIPLRDGFYARPLDSRAYAGFGKAYFHKDGGWAEAPEYQYEFYVHQRKYEGGWETVKHIHRLHPDYPGLAGERDQTLYFKAAHTRNNEFGYDLDIHGTFGLGKGRADNAFSNITVLFKSESPGLLAPFNTYRLTQRIDPDKGALTETVELLMVNDGGERPFMKFEEQGVMFIPALASPAVNK